MYIVELFITIFIYNHGLNNAPFSLDNFASFTTCVRHADKRPSQNYNTHICNRTVMFVIDVSLMGSSLLKPPQTSFVP